MARRRIGLSSWFASRCLLVSHSGPMLPRPGFSSVIGDDVPTLDEHILRTLGEAPEALFASDIAARLNKELRPDSAYITVEVAKHLKGMTDQVAQLPDGRWMLKRLML